MTKSRSQTMLGGALILLLGAVGPALAGSYYDPYTYGFGSTVGFIETRWFWGRTVSNDGRAVTVEFDLWKVGPGYAAVKISTTDDSRFIPTRDSRTATATVQRYKATLVGYRTTYVAIGASTDRGTMVYIRNVRITWP